MLGLNHLNLEEIELLNKRHMLQPIAYELMCKEEIPENAWNKEMLYWNRLNKIKMNLPKFQVRNTGIRFEVYEEAIKYLTGTRKNTHYPQRTYYLVKVTVETLEV